MEHEPERLAAERLNLGADPGDLPLAGHFPEVDDINPLRPEDPAGGVPLLVEDVDREVQEVASSSSLTFIMILRVSRRPLRAF